MNIVSWNCHGMAGKGFGSMVKDLRRYQDANFVILMETHTSGARAPGIVKKFGLNGSFIQEACGHSGGIWCLWDQTFWKVDVISNSAQFIHMKVQWKNDIPWYLTAVYGAPQYAHRQQLWDDLRSLALDISDSWAVIGGFNCTLFPFERRGGADSQVHRDMCVFKQTLQDCHLFDAGYQGAPFTWQKGNLEVRLDRCCINLARRIRFQEAIIQTSSASKIRSQTYPSSFQQRS